MSLNPCGTGSFIYQIHYSRKCAMCRLATLSARLFMLCLMLTMSGCGSLAAEPRIISTVPVPTITPTVPPDVGKPAAPINMARGAEIFEGKQGCALCHGGAGHGDGPLAADLSCPLPDLANLADSRNKTILAW